MLFHLLLSCCLSLKSKAFEQPVAAQRQLQDRITRTKESYLLKRNISVRIFKNMDTDIQYSKFRKESFLIDKKITILAPLIGAILH